MSQTVLIMAFWLRKEHPPCLWLCASTYPLPLPLWNPITPAFWGLNEVTAVPTENSDMWRRTMTDFKDAGPPLINLFLKILVMGTSGLFSVRGSRFHLGNPLQHSNIPKPLNSFNNGYEFSPAHLQWVIFFQPYFVLLSCLISLNMNVMISSFIHFFFCR